MPRKIMIFQRKPRILASCAAVGELESQGPLSSYFDISSPDSSFGMETWEKAEAEMVRQSSLAALKKARLCQDDIDVAFSGDLTNQCASSTFGLKEHQIPHVGLYGACSTFALSLGMGALAMEARLANQVLCEASSHYCSAERQYRYPLEYGCQRPPSAQTTVTGSGCIILGDGEESDVYLHSFLPGIIRDLGVTDANQMGAAMAPSCADTLARYLQETEEKAEQFDLIITGDLGAEGHRIFCDLVSEHGIRIKDNSTDCGILIYNPHKQEVNCGGSGCGCSAVVFCGYIMELFRRKKLKDILLIGTGALLNTTTSLQKESIPAVSHLVRICREE